MQITSRRAHAATLALFLTACGAADIEPPRRPDVTPPPVTTATLVAPAATQSIDPSAREPVFADKDRRKKLEAAFPSLDALIEGEMRAQHMASVTVGVVIDGDLAYAKGFGFADVDKKTVPDADTVYRIGSITKSFTALSILSLRDEGTLSLEDPITRFLPEAGGLVYPTADAKPITLRQLLTHTSGLPGGGKFPLSGATEEEILTSLSGFHLERAPGLSFHYSNLGYVLLGLTVGHASHTSLRDVIKKRILTPLGMTSTAYEIEDVPAARIATPYSVDPTGAVQVAPQWKVSATAGAGALYSSVRDMARYVAFQLSAYPPRSAPDTGSIRRSTLREAHQSAVHARLRVALSAAPKKGDSLVAAWSDNYGFGWESEATCDFDDIVAHTGGMPGYTSAVAFLRERGVGVVVLDNSNADPEALATKVLHALAKTGGLSKRALPAPPAFEGAMKKFLAIYNNWNEAGFAAILTEGRRPDPVEKDELAGYKAVHGNCTSYSVLEVQSPTSARMQLECEHGPMELQIGLGPDGLFEGFFGTTHGLAVPKEVEKLATTVVNLIGKWDEAVYKKHLAKLKRTHDEVVSTFDALRAAHGSCTVRGSTLQGTDRTLDLECARGEALSLMLGQDPKDKEIVTALEIRAVSQGVCPVR